ncbi:zinc-ribbon domain-containing protein [Enterococcus avium]|uniref:zinc-ribbon domain-containing protein n=1 Tax=Enterococcus avium TaxID=33945 RepID=UPI00288DBF17|nr:zinc-ribbon domain-containing protein [Enterococcus avium]MDT2465358.1 zinc-ribbon domain-containing protein [Enterococcus avium]MDT2504785.1 zinc-ribbon domain-containing protein [Enterococcus avium]
MDNSFAKVHTELVSEWSDRNLPVTADMVTYGSNKLMWWKGKCGHEWQTSIKARSKGEGCPICSGARAVEGINDLTTLRPELAAEWSDKNKELRPTMVTIGSSKKIIWKGKCGHEWTATVKSRAISKSGCPYCSHNEVLTGFNDLATLLPHIAEEWSGKNSPLWPTMVGAFANRKVWWKCKKCGNEWNTLISTRSGGSKCPYCSGLILLKGFNDFSTTHPHLAEEWSERNYPLRPDMINAKSRKNVWWKCKECGYEWKAVVYSRVKGSECPVCADRAVLSGYNDLATTDPHLLAEWDYEKNKAVLPTEISRSSMKIVWWKCSIGHSWRGRISDRTLEQKRCKICEEEYLSVLPRLLVMFYAKMKNLSVSTDYDKVIGIPLEMYIKEEKIAIETNEEPEKMVALKEHLCSKREIKLMRVPYKIGMNEVAYAGKIKKAFRSSYVFITSDEEEDVLFIRQRFFEWRRSQ